MRLQAHFGRQSAAAAPQRGESARSKRARDNPPGPTKRETLAIGGGFSFEGLAGLKHRRRSTNHDPRSDLHGVACDDTRRVKTREAIAF